MLEKIMRRMKMIDHSFEVRSPLPTQPNFLVNYTTSYIILHAILYVIYVKLYYILLYALHIISYIYVLHI